MKTLNEFMLGGSTQNDPTRPGYKKKAKKKKATTSESNGISERLKLVAHWDNVYKELTDNVKEISNMRDGLAEIKQALQTSDDAGAGLQEKAVEKLRVSLAAVAGDMRKILGWITIYKTQPSSHPKNMIEGNSIP